MVWSAPTAMSHNAVRWWHICVGCECFHFFFLLTVFQRPFFRLIWSQTDDPDGRIEGYLFILHTWNVTSMIKSVISVRTTHRIFDSPSMFDTHLCHNSKTGFNPTLRTGCSECEVTKLCSFSSSICTLLVMLTFYRGVLCYIQGHESVQHSVHQYSDRVDGYTKRGINLDAEIVICI